MGEVICASPQGRPECVDAICLERPKVTGKTKSNGSDQSRVNE